MPKQFLIWVLAVALVLYGGYILIAGTSATSLQGSLDECYAAVQADLDAREQRGSAHSKATPDACKSMESKAKAARAVLDPKR